MKNIIDILFPLRQYKFSKMDKMRKDHPVLTKLERLPNIIHAIYYMDNKAFVDSKLEELETILKEIEMDELK